MKQFVGVGALLLLFLMPARAQENPPTGTQAPPPETLTPPPAPPETPPYEISAGYDLRVFTQPNSARVGFNGWYGAAQYNFLGHHLDRVSLAVEVSGVY